MRVVALALVACTSTTTTPVAKPPPKVVLENPADGIVEAIDRGDYAPALRSLCIAYERAGMPCSGALRLSLQDPDDVMSGIRDEQDIHMQPMPTDGRHYWANWGIDPKLDEPTERRIANTMLVTVLAHELGHHVAERFGCHPDERGLRELRADELSTPIVRAIMKDPRLVEVDAKIREVAGMLIDHGGGDRVPSSGSLPEWAKTVVLPRIPAEYAALHLARQRRLLRDPPDDTARAACVERWQSFAKTRVIDGHRTLSTVRTYPRELARIALDRDGRAYRLEDRNSNELRIVALDDPTSALEIPTPDGTGWIDAFAMYSPTKGAVIYNGHLWRFEGTPVVVTVADVEAKELAFAADGTLWTAREKDDPAGERDAWFATPLGIEPPRVAIPVNRWAARPWGDGRPGNAWPSMFAIDGASIVVADQSSSVLRATTRDGGLVTLAGWLPGRRDGPAATAELFQIVAITVLRDGTIRTVERSSTDLAIRDLR